LISSETAVENFQLVTSFEKRNKVLRPPHTVIPGKGPTLNTIAAEVDGDEELLACKHWQMLLPSKECMLALYHVYISENYYHPSLQQQQQLNQMQGNSSTINNAELVFKKRQEVCSLYRKQLESLFALHSQPHSNNSTKTSSKKVTKQTKDNITTNNQSSKDNEDNKERQGSNDSDNRSSSSTHSVPIPPIIHPATITRFVDISPSPGFVIKTRRIFQEKPSLPVNHPMAHSLAFSADTSTNATTTQSKYMLTNASLLDPDYKVFVNVYHHPIVKDILKNELSKNSNNQKKGEEECFLLLIHNKIENVYDKERQLSDLYHVVVSSDYFVKAFVSNNSSSSRFGSNSKKSSALITDHYYVEKVSDKIFSLAHLICYLMIFVDN